MGMENDMPIGRKYEYSAAPACRVRNVITNSQKTGRQGKRDGCTNMPFRRPSSLSSVSCMGSSEDGHCMIKAVIASGMEMSAAEAYTALTTPSA